jgi:ABC-2 type transport system permease protein
VPLIIYGIYANIGILFFINLIFILIIFPIFIGLIISVIMMFLMKTIKIFKNKDLMQLIISFILIFLIMIFLSYVFKYVFNNEELIEQNQENILNNINEKIININNYFLTINPSIKILTQKNIFKIIFNFLKLIFINLFGFIIFIFLGNKFYLKQLLKNNFYTKNKNNKKINLNKKCKKNKINISYIKKEFKLLFKNPLFFIQSIYPVILFTVTVSILLIILIPKIIDIFNMEEYKETLQNLKFDFDAVCLILGLTQIIGLFNYSSITAFSREGQDAYIMKFLPINLYKQFIYKNIPQIFVNIISSIFILGIIFYEISAIKLKYIFIIFILNILLILINSFILSFIDLINPKINWKAEYEIFKNNKNKLLQYILIIFNILFLMYFDDLFINYNLNISLLILGLILLFIFIILNLFIIKFKNKLFKKIN